MFWNLKSYWRAEEMLLCTAVCHTLAVFELYLAQRRTSVWSVKAPKFSLLLILWHAIKLKALFWYFVLVVGIYNFIRVYIYFVALCCLQYALRNSRISCVVVIQTHLNANYLKPQGFQSYCFDTVKQILPENSSGLRMCVLFPEMLWHLFW